MQKEILLGDEAVALGAIHAGLTAAYSYPGTPASEIMDYLIRASESHRKFIASWSVNEKVAYEEALGVSFAGKRALVSMKHVGLNVAADPFMSSSLTGANGGFVVVAADDPSMHSSQNEQDSRFFAKFAQILCFEPSDHQEAYDMTRQAFDLSERMKIPVMVRMVTRLAHSRSGVRPGEPRSQNSLKPGARQCWTLLPTNARVQFRKILDLQSKLLEFANGSPFNRLVPGPIGSRLGIITSGIAYNYVMENIGDVEPKPSILKVSTYPIPEGLIKTLMNSAETILVAEEGYPLIEGTLKGFFGIAGKNLVGKLSGHLPLAGELSPEVVRRAMDLKPLPTQKVGDFKLSSRPPQLCQGCPHADTFNALKKALKGYPGSTIFSDIGCYTLGYYPPYNAVDSCVCMGASVGMAKGGAEAGIHPSIAVIGDSTFGHSGMTSLLSAAAFNTNMVLIVLDNCTVAMTGGQPSFATGERLLKIIEGVGVPKEHIRVIEPLPKNLETNAGILKEEIQHPGISVVVSVRECLEEARKKKKR